MVCSQWFVFCVVGRVLLGCKGTRSLGIFYGSLVFLPLGVIV